jgi:hypothetical protein
MEGKANLTSALADRYKIERELGQGGTRLKSRIGSTWLRHVRYRELRVAERRPAEPRLEPRKRMSL